MKLHFSKKSITAPLFAAVLFVSSIIYAQVKPATTNDPKAKTVLDVLSKKYRSFKTIKASFKLFLENTASKTHEEKSGSLVLKGAKYVVEMGTIQIISDAKTVWTFTKDENEVTISKAEQKNKGINPSEIFTMYENGFLYQLVPNEKEGGKEFQVIELTPTDKTKNYFKIKLYIDKTTQSIMKSKIFDKNGNRYSYEIVQFTPNVAIDDSYFSFDTKKHPGVEVTDNRD
jgi:outer membrane lipoprotein-sorting protein